MAENILNKTPATVENQTGAIDPTPTKIELRTVAQVRRELSKVYRGMRDNSIDMGDGAKLTYVLIAINKIIVDTELEARITLLEGNK